MSKMFWLFPMLMISSVAEADYTAELGLQVENSSNVFLGSIESDVDSNFYDAIFYFSPVSTQNGPIAEAGFLSRKSSAGIGYADIDAEVNYDAGSNESSSFKEDRKYLFGRFVAPGSDLILVTGMEQSDASSRHGYTSAGGDPEVINSVNRDTDNYSVAVGRYLTDMSAWMLGFERIRRTSFFKLEFFLPDYRYQIESEEEKTDSILIDYKHVLSLYGDNYLNINGRLVLSETDIGSLGTYKTIQEEVYVDWYLSERFSMGMELIYSYYDSNDFGGYDGETQLVYKLGTQYYFNERIALSASFGGSRISGDGDTISESDDFSLGLHINI